MDQPLFRTGKYYLFLIMGLVMVYRAFVEFEYSIQSKIDIGYHSLYAVLFCAGSMAFILFFFLWQNVYEIYKDRIRILSVLGREKESIPLKDIKLWKESSHVQMQMGGTSHKLTLYTWKNTIRIRSQLIGRSNYDMIKNLVTENVKSDQHFLLVHTIKMKKQAMIGGITIICLCLAILLFFGKYIHIFFQFCLLSVLFASCFPIYDGIKTIKSSKKELEKLNRGF